MFNDQPKQASVTAAADIYSVGDLALISINKYDRSGTTFYGSPVKVEYDKFGYRTYRTEGIELKHNDIVLIVKVGKKRKKIKYSNYQCVCKKFVGDTREFLINIEYLKKMAS